nr:unnamed protein product [Digitaria exilis]
MRLLSQTRRNAFMLQPFDEVAWQQLVDKKLGLVSSARAHLARLGSARLPNEPSPSQCFSSFAKRAEPEPARELKQARWWLKPVNEPSRAEPQPSRATSASSFHEPSRAWLGSARFHPCLSQGQWTES